MANPDYGLPNGKLANLPFGQFANSRSVLEKL
jgi:hypothetical protein